MMGCCTVRVPIELDMEGVKSKVNCQIRRLTGRERVP